MDSPVLDTYQEIFVSSGWRKNNNNICPHLRRLSVKQTLVILPLFRSLGIGPEELIAKNPVRLEGRPGDQPERGAQPFNTEQLTKLRQAVGADSLAFILLR